jgi:hypothetical protein
MDVARGRGQNAQTQIKQKQQGLRLRIDEDIDQVHTEVGQRCGHPQVVEVPTAGIPI